MLASNWPVSLLRVEYGSGWSDLRSLMAELAPDQLDRVCAGTATDWYRLRTSS